MDKEASDHIDLKESWSINHWCEELNLRAEELREIVKRVGPSVAAVREYVAKKLLVATPLNW